MSAPLEGRHHRGTLTVRRHPSGHVARHACRRGPVLTCKGRSKDRRRRKSFAPHKGGGEESRKHCPTVHGMPHARLLLGHALLWGHYAAHSCHRGSSHKGLTRPGYETLVTGQLGLHLFLTAEKTKQSAHSHQGNAIIALTVHEQTATSGYKCHPALISRR